MKDLNIRSLRQLRRRKYAIVRQVRMYEEDFQEDMYNLMHPFGETGRFSETNCDTSSYTGVSRIAVNVIRVIDMARLGVSIFKDFRK